jgi:hypothetical protein
MRALKMNRRDALLREVLGQDLYNRLWGAELEQVGERFDAVVKKIMRARNRQIRRIGDSP